MIGIIGTGNMGQALIDAMNIGIYYGHKNNSTAKDELDVVKKSDVIILAVKPKDYDKLLIKIKDSIADKIIILIAAGYSIKRAEGIVGTDKKISRIMPNTPVKIKKGVSSICFNLNMKQFDREYIIKELEKTGAVIEISEDDFEVFTAVSGSLPAYVYIMIEALADAAVLHGMKRNTAYEVISKAISGSANMVVELNEHPAKLKDDVCSPAGTTIEAVKELEDKGFRSALIAAVDVCVKKAKNMNK